MRFSSFATTVAAIVSTGLVAGTALLAANGAFGSASLAVEATPQTVNEPYDGRFSFVRISFATAGGGLRGFGRRGGGRQQPWAHDYPRAERNFMQILIETTYIRPYMDGGRVFSTDDPEMTKYPLAYISEPGYWNPSEEEVTGLSNYLQKGGFLIADDFRDADWYNFEAQMQRVIPGSVFEELDETHDIFDSFFRIENLSAILSPTYGTTPVYMGLHEDNDPTRRLMVIANYNNDIGEYWEFSDVGWYPIDLSNEAYKLGVNYLVYAMTH
jgi:Domain of unknown function (DUF4159)